jgi:hypothetical protein
VQKNNINKHILNSPYKTTSKAVKYISFFAQKSEDIKEENEKELADL